MAKVTKDELLKKFNDFIGENATDEALSIMEDISDSMEPGVDVSEFEIKISELEQKVTDTENAWREKYRNRFMNNDVTPDTAPESVDSEVDNGSNDDIEPPSFEDIAKEF